MLHILIVYTLLLLLLLLLLHWHINKAFTLLTYVATPRGRGGVFLPLLVCVSGVIQIIFGCLL